MPRSLKLRLHAYHAACYAYQLQRSVDYAQSEAGDVLYLVVEYEKEYMYLSLVETFYDEEIFSKVASSLTHEFGENSNSARWKVSFT